MRWRRLRTLLVREVRATFRDPFTVTILIAVPVAALLLFGFLMTTEVKHLDLGVHDAAATPSSRRLVADLAAQGTFDPHFYRSVDGIDRAIGRGEIAAAIVVPPDFDRQLERMRRGGAPPEVEVVYDAAETVLAGNAEGYLRGIVTAAAANLVAPPRVGARPGLELATRTLFNPTLDGTAFMVSGVFGFVLSFLAVLITAVSIVGERANGTFEQLQVTPATALEILLGKLLPLGAMFAFDVFLMAVIAGVFLGVWPNGSLVFFLAVSAGYVLISLAIGLLISATSTTTSEAVQRSVLFSIPLVQLSGFILPVRNMPVWLQWFTSMFPATHYITVSRGIYLRGEGPLTLWPQLLYIFASGVVLVWWASRRVEARA